MTKEVNFNSQTTVITQITIYDPQDNEIEDYELFSNIIDDYGDILDYTTTHEYGGKEYKIVVEHVVEETMYIDFEIY